MLLFFSILILHLRWFPRDYRAVIREENWANYPFKKKLYLYSADFDSTDSMLSFRDSPG